MGSSHFLTMLSSDYLTVLSSHYLTMSSPHYLTMLSSHYLTMLSSHYLTMLSQLQFLSLVSWNHFFPFPLCYCQILHFLLPFMVSLSLSQCLSLLLPPIYLSLSPPSLSLSLS